MSQEVKVFFETIEDVKKFCDVCNNYDFEIDLYTGKYVVDAKSIMGIFSLDLSKPINLKAACECDSEFFKEAKSYIVE